MPKRINKKIKFEKSEVTLIGVSLASMLGFYFYGKKVIKDGLQSSGLAVLDPTNKNLIPTSKATIIVTDTKATTPSTNNSAVTDTTSETGSSSSLFDYNNPIYHASANYWLSKTTGIFYDEYGNKITVENDGKISIPIWSAVKQGVKSVFSLGGLI